MRMSERWIPWCVGLCAGMLLLPFLFSIQPLFFAVLCLTGVALAGMVRTLLSSTHSQRDAYDLAELRRLEENEELRRIREDITAPAVEQSFCIHCGEVYDPRFGACPHCKRM